MAYKILAFDGLQQTCIDELKKLGEVTLDSLEDEETLCQLIEDVDVLVIRSKPIVTQKSIERAKNLKLIARPGVAINNIEKDAQELCKERGIKIITTPQATTESVAEMTLALALSLFRHIAQAHETMKADKWDKKKFTGFELNGKKWGVLGFGRIGQTVAKFAKAFGCELYMFDPIVGSDVSDQLGVKKIEDLDEFFSNCEILSIHVPLLPQTKHMINTESIKKLPGGARIINISRGPIIDEPALIEALKTGQLSGAALDVFENEPPTGSPLLELENVVLTPHLGGSTYEGQDRATEQLVEQIKAELK